jgi:hypothetical protein
MNKLTSVSVVIAALMISRGVTEASEAGLKVKVHFGHDDRICVVESGDLCSIPNGGKSGNAGETVTFTFEPGKIEEGEEIIYCFESWDECRNAINGPEKEPIHIYNTR